MEDELEQFYKTVGSNVKKKREEKGLTQLQLSQKMCLKSPGLISQGELYLNNQHFNLSHLYKIAAILDCSVQEFFEGVKVVSWECEE
ncbi:helix-turn-helix domain-containing protein [Sulfurovum sp. TSL1]|uniref:helix-turn-helix domain-containing protein n=1 Tax=Sulfurovum sp. TSL1 TaxID=2826994 RepID=UPI001CC7D87A|nr:helix-turn-helix transcriptional regulator [Sulfurovum sp. TSL1]